MKASTILNFVLIAASIFAFSESNPLFGVLLLLWVIDRLFAYRNPIDERLSLLEWDNRARAYLAFDMTIPEILKHPSLDKVYESRRKAGDTKTTTKDEWLKNLLAIYERKYKQSSGLSSVKFQINGNQLFKNGEIDFSNRIYQEVSIPFVYADGKDDDLLWSDTSRCITIRAFTVNGFLQVQLGRFTKEDSPNVSSRGFGSGTYENYAIVTQFPLLYCSSTLPPKYFNLAFAASESYMESHATGKLKTGPNNAWREINAEVRKYVELCSRADQPITSRGMKLLDEFHKKAQGHLAKHGFEKDKYTESYRNACLHVYVPAGHDDGIGKFYSTWHESDI